MPPPPLHLIGYGLCIGTAPGAQEASTTLTGFQLREVCASPFACVWFACSSFFRAKSLCYVLFILFSHFSFVQLVFRMVSMVTTYYATCSNGQAAYYYCGVDPTCTVCQDDTAGQFTGNLHTHTHTLTLTRTHSLTRDLFSSSRLHAQAKAMKVSVGRRSVLAVTTVALPALLAALRMQHTCSPVAHSYDALTSHVGG